MRSGVSGILSAGLFDHLPTSAQTDSRRHSGLREAWQVRLLSSQMPVHFGNNRVPSDRGGNVIILLKNNVWVILPNVQV